MATKKIPTAQLIKTKRFAQLYDLVQGLKGKKCWKAAFGYGGELHLHFGARIACHNPRMAGETKGAWILGTCGTPWHLVAPEDSVFSENHCEEDLVPQIRGLEGAVVMNIALAVPGGAIEIDFSNKRSLFVTPSARDRRYDVPYWELFVPNHRFVVFGPGNAWSYGRSDVESQRQSGPSSKSWLSNIPVVSARVPHESPRFHGRDPAAKSKCL
ncbi:MAG: hypothetical protein NTV86_08520 [Planctomycetota bacterium]|nr:hypothetical protein [Planctomycetota bacterium]